MTRFLVAVLLVLPSLAAADPDARFARLLAAAEPLGPLGPFLERYVGECEAGAGRACRAAAEDFRRRYQGRRLALVVDEDSAGMLAPGAFDEATRRASIRVTPFFAASAYALTHGAPRRTDARGNPVLPLLHVQGQVDEDWDARMFQRLFQMRGVRMQVVFTPQGVWSLPRRGGGRIQGVSARVEGMQVVMARTGAPLGVWLGR